MRCFSKLIKLKKLYNLFLFLALLNIFFSTENSVAKTFSIKEIEISSPFNASFDKNKIINRGFVEAYKELILTIAQSKDQKKLQNSSIKEVKSLAIKIYQKLNLRGFTRSDFILKNNKFYFLEVNTNPGLTKESILPQQAKAAGININKLFESVLK